MNFGNIRQLAYIIASAVFLWVLMLTENTVVAQSHTTEVIYDIGDIFHFPDGSQGVVCYVDPDNPQRGWVVDMTDLGGSTKTYGIYDENVENIAQLLGLATGGDMNSWGQLNGWTFHGQENTMKLKASGHSPAANAVSDGWYIPDAMQLRLFYALIPVFEQMKKTSSSLNSFELPKKDENQSAKYFYWSSTAVVSSTYNPGPNGIASLNNASGQINTNNPNNTSLTTKSRVRCVRDFQVGEAQIYWVDNYPHSSYSVKPHQTTEYDWQVVFHEDTFSRSSWMVVHPVYTVNDNQPWTYETVCSSPERYTSQLNPNFTNLDISKPLKNKNIDVKLQSVDRCDSTIRLVLTVNPSYHFYDTVQLCREELAAFTWRERSFAAAGDYEDAYTTVGCGCDSVYHLHLIVTPMPEIPLQDTYGICQGGSLTLDATCDSCMDVVDFVHYDETFDRVLSKGSNALTNNEIAAQTDWFASGTKVFSDGLGYVRLGSNAGVGSITSKSMNLSDPFTMHMKIRGWRSDYPPAKIRVTVGGQTVDTAVAGSNSEFFDLRLPFAAATANSTFTIAVVNEKLPGQAYINLRAEIDEVIIEDNKPCTYTWKKGNSVVSQNATLTISTSGTYTVTAKTANNCSSTKTLTVDVMDAVPGDTTATACGSFTWHNVIYNSTPTTVPTWLIPNGSTMGCDSLVRLHLTVYQPTEGIDEQEACGSFTWIDGHTYNASTNEPTYTFPSGNSHGCDSTVHLHLTIYNPEHQAYHHTACRSYTWNSAEYTESGVYTYSHNDEHGCKQVDTLHLTIVDPTISLNTLTPVTICAGGNVSMTANGTIAPTTNRTVSYVWTGPGDFNSTEQGWTLSGVTTENTGDYTVVATVTSTEVSNCSASDTKTVHVTVNPVITNKLYATICMGSSYTELTGS